MGKTAETAALLSIEELAKTRGVQRSVLAAVAQERVWAVGKKVTVAEFIAAVEFFLNGAMGGSK
jgi:hypothetical protein